MHDSIGNWFKKLLPCCSRCLMHFLWCYNILSLGTDTLSQQPEEVIHHHIKPRAELYYLSISVTIYYVHEGGSLYPRPWRGYSIRWVRVECPGGHSFSPKMNFLLNSAREEGGGKGSDTGTIITIEYYLWSSIQVSSQEGICRKMLDNIKVIELFWNSIATYK